MNISQPVASDLTGVSFDFLPSDEIKEYSVKRISNPTTFDSLLNPTPGGLYDPALGASAGDPCATCHLSSGSCPGHAGHIELPVPVYQPLFMLQTYRLLRCKCRYCHRFRCSRVDSNLLLCKLRLLQYGFVVEAGELDNIRPEDLLLNGVDHGSEDEDQQVKEPIEQAQDDLIRLRNSYVERVLRRHLNTLSTRAATAWKLSVVGAKRRALIKAFFSLGLKRKCLRCKGISPPLRKDGAVKLFEKSLTAKEMTANTRNGLDQSNPLVLMMKQQRRRGDSQRKSARLSLAVDEAIADMDIGDDLSDQSSDGSNAGAGSDGSDYGKNKPPSKEDAIEAEAPKQTFVSSGEARASLMLLFEKEQELLQMLYGQCLRSQESKKTPTSADIFFASHVMVPPNRYRPGMKTGRDEIAEAAQNSLFKSIILKSQAVSDVSMDLAMQLQSGLDEDEGVRQRTGVDLMRAWVTLQEAVNSLYDKELNPLQGRAAQRNSDGIKQLLEKKEGLFRMNMMGKRVNFAARSVISPDPNIETNEVGVPPVFAEKLTYPEPVTDHNYRELANCVINGEHWPGASAVENERGEVINLRFKSLDERMAIANSLLAPSSSNFNGTTNKKVYRHLRDGDVVLMNRQPTLHKPSIMGHKTRVLRQEKTLRMHYANCNTYNADFDGDEMNMHLPQNAIAKTEALHIADTDHQYLSATAGKPLRGLIQDHISVSVWMSNKDTWFTQDEYYQLIYSCLRPEHDSSNDGRIMTVTPAIIKPRALWSGKQIMTTILANIQPPDQPGITVAMQASVAADRWGDHREEGEVRFSQGYFVSGVLDKSQLGPTSYGLIHAVQEIYGPSVAGILLGVTSRLLTKFLNMRAFSCGIEDLLLTPEGNRTRDQSLQGARMIGLKAASYHVSLEQNDPDEHDEEMNTRLEEVLRDEEKHKGLDLIYNSRTAQLTGDITKSCLPNGLRKAFPRNQMQTMTGSGAKGSPVNASLISCNLGQQVLEGRRVPVMVSGRSLPCFDPYDTHIRAGGYITDRFLTGVRPQEYFFHCMAGREGLIDTAVKTSRSGYLQRCLIKGMEGIRVDYDHSVRDSDGALIQTLFGEDSLDITKQTHLQEFKFIGENSAAFFAHLNLKDDLAILQTLMDDEGLKYNEKATKAYRRSQRLDVMDPALARYSPTRWLGSTSESFTQALKTYLDDNPDELLYSKSNKIDGMPKSNFKALANLKYMKSIVDPGEAVGVIAGQSIGEPSTQMTLNTFHLAGHSAKNVTLGIPRLREIIMTASADIKTPTMTLVLMPELKQEDRELFAKSISRLTLAELIEKVSVSESSNSSDAKTFTIRVDFYPGSEYSAHYGVRISRVGDVLEEDFVPRLQLALRKELKKKAKEAKSTVEADSDAIPQIGQAARHIAGEEARPGPDAEGGLDDDDDDDDDDDGEGDATNTKQKANQRQPVSYEDAEEAEDPTLANEPRGGPEDEGIGLSPPESDSEFADGANAQGTKRLVNGTSERGSRVRNNCADVTRFTFDEDQGDWCEIELQYPRQNVKMLALSIVERAAKAAIIQQIPGIGTGTLTSEKLKVGGQMQEVFSVMTDGVNLLAMRDYQHVTNPHKTTSNDIVAMLQHYGVEACRATIVREMYAVFSGHGISVDHRHLTLVADFMTKGGGFTPFSRIGIKDATSPFLKMSFETTINFLREAVLEGEREDLSSPSARIVTGKLGRMGTGCFDVLTEADARPE